MATGHRCDVGTIDYSQADDGLIVCVECGRTWTLRVHSFGEDGRVSYRWFSDPWMRNEPWAMAAEARRRDRSAAA